MNKDFRNILMRVTNPGRYVGGEYGIIRKEPDSRQLSFALSFPDLYEIGMSNQAIKIIYNILNASDNINCERVFAPAPDMEEQLRKYRTPLFSLENNRAVRDFDILGFSIGYELTATNILNIIELSNIPLRCSDRGEGDPIIIAGGPAITNPAVMGQFLDAVFIGEAEGEIAALMAVLAEMKKNGASRSEMMSRLKASPYVWAADKTETVQRSIWSGFSSSLEIQKPLIPSIGVVQDHGVVEIMRGCPTGCRFCHAGIIYRPFREKSIPQILEEIDFLVRKCGYKSITLASLSSGDYHQISQLLKTVNHLYADLGVSFSVPSLRVDSFTLGLLDQLASVRKGGLTFAIETPQPSAQQGLNKDVPAERVIDILREAKKNGWKKAKFYFMTGLPSSFHDDEAGLIIDYVNEVYRATGVSLNINVGTFIPKPHTPFQWSPQLSEMDSLDRIMTIRRELRGKQFKVGYHSPFASFIEGILTRGDERAGEVLLSAYQKGARLDAWEEHLDFDIWRSAIAEADWDVENEVCRERDLDETLPWDGIDIGVTKNYLKNERKKALESKHTPLCDTDCTHNCGLCVDGMKPVVAGDWDAIQEEVETHHSDSDSERPSETVAGVDKQQVETDTVDIKVYFRFIKMGASAFMGHLDTMNIFMRAIQRAEIKMIYSQGYNPKPKLEFAQPLSLGFTSDGEVASIRLREKLSMDEFVSRVNDALPEGIVIRNAVAPPKELVGKKSLMAMFWGGEYRIEGLDQEDEKALIQFIDSHWPDLEGESKRYTDKGVVLTMRKNPVKWLGDFSEREDFLVRFKVSRLRCIFTNKELDKLLFD